MAAHNTSGFKGVRYSKRYRNWRANIGIMNRDYSLGSHATKAEAAIAFNIGSVEFQRAVREVERHGQILRRPTFHIGKTF